MACPVNHPLFHAVVFLIGVLVVLSRYVRAYEDGLGGGVASIGSAVDRNGWEVVNPGSIVSRALGLPAPQL